MCVYFVRNQNVAQKKEIIVVRLSNTIYNVGRDYIPFCGRESDDSSLSLSGHLWHSHMLESDKVLIRDST